MRRVPLKLVATYIKKHIGVFLVSMFFLCVEAAADLLQPTFMSFIVDKGIANADIHEILRCGLVMLGIAAAGALGAVMRDIFSSRTSTAVSFELRQDMYAAVQNLSLENIDRLEPASIITRLTNDVTQIQDFVNSIMRMMVKAPLTCIGAITLIIIQTPRQAPVMGAILLIAAVLIVCNIRIGYPKFGFVQKKLDGLNGVTREYLSSVRVVKAFRAEDEETEKFTKASTGLAGANTSAMRTMAVFTPLINLTVNFGIVLLLWISGGQDAAGIGRLMASVNYMTQVLFAVTMIANTINNAVRAMASSVRIREVLDEKPAQKKAEHPAKNAIEGGVEFQNVSFAYADAGSKSLKDISFRVKPGDTVGIIGPTGSGKSTLVNLIPRFYDATAGKVLLDGCDVTEMDEADIRGAIAVVPQKALLFSGSIRDNLKWGRSGATEEEIKKAARIAAADGFVEKMPEGYDSKLGQGGVNLSGGQKQRLSLARALVRNPKILILDDCTSALDAETERAVLDGLSALGGKFTLFLISQRVSTVMKADFILCLDNGRLMGAGTHEELVENCKTYREICDSQIGGGDGRLK